jgi:hypothetical protein
MSSTTESVESVQSLEATVDLETVLAALKEFGCADLFKVIKTATIEAEKRSKAEAKPKKDASAPKQPTPKQLQKSTAWVKFTLMFSMENGWEEFIVRNKKSGEEILMPASVEIDGKHVYPDGKPMILTHAMSLSKQRWAPKAKEGTHEELYNQFSASFDAQIAMEPEELEEFAKELPPLIVRKTAEEKAAEVAAKKAEIEEAKAIAKLARESAAELKKQAKAAEKEAEKQAKAAAKAAAKKPVAVKAAPAAVKVVAPVAAVKAAVKPAVKKPVAVMWSCPADGAVHPWTYKGAKYLRNSDHQVWREDADGGCGDWCGVYLIDGDRIDDSVEEPDFE